MTAYDSEPEIGIATLKWPGPARRDHADSVAARIASPWIYDCKPAAAGDQAGTPSRLPRCTTSLSAVRWDTSTPQTMKCLRIAAWSMALVASNVCRICFGRNLDDFHPPRTYKSLNEEMTDADILHIAEARPASSRNV